VGFGIEIEYTVGGRRVSQQEWERHLREAPTRATKEAVKQKLSRVRCPAHGQSPKVTFRETSEGFDVSISGCCEELTERARRALRYCD
jgi:ubiquitin C-terminal hydrolase